MKKLCIGIICCCIVFLFFYQVKWKDRKKFVRAQSVISKFTGGYIETHVEKLPQLDFLDQRILVSGEEEAQKHRVIFAGIARDNGEDLPVTINNIERIGKYFKDYRVIIFENDSHDKTKEFFEKWQKDNHKVKIISEDFHNKKRPSIQFLADVRNRYLDTLLKDKQYKDFDLVMMLDMDMAFGFDVRGILDSLAKIKDWDVVCSNGIFRNNRMYDAFAFRSDDFPWAPYDQENYWHIIVPSIQKVYNPNTGLVSVHSCFGGMAIYKKKFLQGCRYASIKDDCEHVYLHQCMREKNKARITMNPTQIVRYSHWRKAS